MFKKIIATSLAAIALTVTTAGATAMVVSAAENYKPIVNSKQNYHYCKPGTCQHQYDKAGKPLAMYPMGRWGFVFSNANDHKDSYKRITITTYGYNDKSKSHYKKTAVKNEGTKPEIVSPTASIDGTVSKVVYNGEIYRTAETGSGILQQFFIGSFRTGVPIK